METRLLVKDDLKRQLLEFIEELEEPFNIEFIMRNCLKPVSRIEIHDILCELVDEGRIVRVDGEYYMPVKTLIRRWLRGKIRRVGDEVILDGLELPKSLVEDVREFIRSRAELGYVDEAEFIRDAIRRKLKSLREI